MGTREAFISTAGKSVGISGRPNSITRAYAKRHGTEFLNAPWCMMGVTEWARNSGNKENVLPGGDRAYTVYYAQDFAKRGMWKSGTVANITKYAKPGHTVLFDWAGSNATGAVDHVGVIENVLTDGRVQTIEANTSDSCARRVRSAGDIAGFCVVNFDTAPLAWPYGKRIFEFGDKGGMIRECQIRLNAHGASPKLVEDGDFGEKTRKETTDFQAKMKLEKDGKIGPKTGTALWKK